MYVYIYYILNHMSFYRNIIIFEFQLRIAKYYLRMISEV